MKSTLQDLKFAWRTLLGNHTFTGVAVFALALGIGASTAVFSVVNAVLLRPLPYHDPDRLVMVSAKFPLEEMAGVGLSEPEVLDIQQQQKQIFSGVAAVYNTKVNVTGTEEPERLPVAYTSASFFRVLGVSPTKGRAYSDEEDAVGHDDVVVLSSELWQRRFGGDPEIVGKKILLNDKSHTVLGIMPRGFRFGEEEAGLWLPIAINPSQLAPRSQHYVSMVARLAPDISLKRAQAAMKIFANTLSQQHPDSYQAGSWEIDVISLQDFLVGNVRPALQVLLGAIVFVLLIACANVANLLLARAVNREKEVAIRSALGAGRNRLVRQMMTESLVLACLGGLTGLLLALLTTHALASFGRGQIPRLTEISADWRVLAFTLLASIATGLLFGLVPAVQVNKTSLNDVLREGAPTSGVRRSRFRNALVVAELAVALMLLIGAGLMVKSFLLLRSINPGFNPHNVLSVQLLLPRTRYPDPAQQTAFFEHVVREVKTLPGVTVVGAVSQLPLSEDYWSSQMLAEGKVLNTITGHPSTEVDWRTVTPDYFRAMEIPLKAGRYFGDGDNEQGMKVAIVDERMAKRVWPNESPIGKRIQEASFTEKKPWLTVVGVVESVKHYNLTSDSRELVYLPQSQRATPYRAMSLVVRTVVPPRGLIDPIRAKVRAIDPNQPVSRLKTMDDLFAEAIAKPRFYLILLSIFSGVALILATIGTYGLISYGVSQRSRELGIRMALGANRGDVLKLIVGQGLVLTLAGLAVGLVAAFSGTRVLAGLLYGVSASDPVTYALVLLALGGVSILASYIPARRATRVDPAIVLRQQ
jgi:predicted permease